MVRTKMINTARGLLGVCLLALSWNAQAASLNLTLLDSPDVASFFINTSYDAGIGALDASGWAIGVDLGAGNLPIAGGLHLLQASIDSGGNLLGGTITIRGTVASLGHISGTLLTGDLTMFGFGENGDPLEFLFTPTGGDLASLYGNEGGIILSQTGFSGVFTSDFGSTSSVSDVAAIPVPAAIWLMLSAVAGLISVRRR